MQEKVDLSKASYMSLENEILTKEKVLPSNI